jgi:mannose-6-phosphate isomerase-like protein (cupin superfamily)
MKKYVDNIEKITLDNNNFRQVLFTGEHCQLVAMSLLPGEDIGMEVHPNVDQFFRFESGEGKVIINGETSLVTDGSAVVVTAGSEHNIINISTDRALKLYTIYSPPNHPDGTIHKTKAEALAHEKE